MDKVEGGFLGSECADVAGGMSAGEQTPNTEEQAATVEQWHAALQELCKNAPPPQAAYLTNPIAGAQAYGLWSGQPLLTAYGAIPFFSGVFPGGYQIPPTSVGTVPTDQKDDGMAEDDEGQANQEARNASRPTKRAKKDGGNAGDDVKTGVMMDGSQTDLMNMGMKTPMGGTVKGSTTVATDKGQTIQYGKGALSIDALAAAARAAALSSGTSSSDLWMTPDAGMDPKNLGLMDEKELKRQRRKQSNRESARRSRLRKQQECENLQRQVRELSVENEELKRQVQGLREQLEGLREENMNLQAKVEGKQAG